MDTVYLFPTKQTNYNCTTPSWFVLIESQFGWSVSGGYGVCNNIAVPWLKWLFGRRSLICIVVSLSRLEGLLKSFLLPTKKQKPSETSCSSRLQTCLIYLFHFVYRISWPENNDTTKTYVSNSRLKLWRRRFWAIRFYLYLYNKGIETMYLVAETEISSSS